jgi:hypothetical protein
MGAGGGDVRWIVLLMRPFIVFFGGDQCAPASGTIDPTGQLKLLTCVPWATSTGHMSCPRVRMQRRATREMRTVLDNTSTILLFGAESG